eukprot:9863363-Karenia_brevis.AAC.1
MDSQAPTTPQEAANQIIPKGKGRHRDIRLSQGAQPSQPAPNPNTPFQPPRELMQPRRSQPPPMESTGQVGGRGVPLVSATGNVLAPATDSSGQTVG